MSYTINLTNGNVFATIPDGTINTSSSMTLIGKNYAGYGQFLDDNFIHLLENAANATAPSAPLVGQLWFNTTSGVLNVYKGGTATWKAIGGAAAASSAPTNNTTGDLWYDTSGQQLNVWTGTAWLLVGPSVTNGTGALATTVTSNATAYSVIQLLSANTTVGFISSYDSNIVPTSPITGFTSINPGITLSSNISGAKYWGVASDSTLLNGIPSTSYMQSVANTGTTGTLAVQNNTGLSVGNNGDFVVGVTGISNVIVRNKTSGGNLIFGVNVAGVTSNAITIDGGTGNVSIPNLILSGGTSTFTTLTANTILNGGVSGTGNIGNTSFPFNTIFAKSTSAQYADLAERFAADDVYEAGTVVEIGGSAEITKCDRDLSSDVFGVISMRAAYLMNALSGNDATHPPVAMTGRVPVKVNSVVRKGDRLVSAGKGFARSALPGEATAFNVIGRSLEDRLETTPGTVLAIVSTK